MDGVWEMAATSAKGVKRQSSTLLVRNIHRERGFTEGPGDVDGSTKLDLR